MKTSVKDWYLSAYADDRSGAETIDTEATFAGAFNCLDDYGDIYLYLGGVDSYIRERVFERLACLIGVEYEYIYSQWMRCHTHSPIIDKRGDFTGYFRESETGLRIPAEEIERRYNSYNE